MLENLGANETDKNYVLPKNIRQIGEIGEGTRIYIEDYAYTYIHQYTSKHKAEEQILLLIGERKRHDNHNILLINGAIKCEHIIRDKGNVSITEQTLVTAHESATKFFGEHQFVGWVYTQPGYGVLLTSYLTALHKKYFSDENEVLLIFDPIEKEEIFFENTNDQILQKEGFFIYYDKNSKMHNYMIENKIVTNQIEINDMDKVIEMYRKKDQSNKEEYANKKFISMLSVICGMLILICGIIGFGLILNMDETTKLKQAYANVYDNYTNLSKKYSELVSNISNEDDAQYVAKINGNQTISEGDNSNNEVNENQTNESNKSNQKIEQMDNGKSSNTTADAVSNEDKDKTSKQDGTAQTHNKDESTNIEQENKSETASSEKEDKGSTAEVSTTRETMDYVIKEGDSLRKICYEIYKNDEMLEVIKELNNIENEDIIYAGQTLVLIKP